jgi:hypothetical protein
VRPTYSPQSLPHQRPVHASVQRGCCSSKGATTPQPSLQGGSVLT